MPIIIFKIFVAFLKRKMNIYTVLKRPDSLSKKLREINLDRLSIKFDDENYWNDTFKINDDEDLKWSVSRNYKLNPHP